MKCLKCGSKLLSTGMCSNLMCDYIIGDNVSTDTLDDIIKQTNNLVEKGNFLDKILNSDLCYSGSAPNYRLEVDILSKEEADNLDLLIENIENIEKEHWIYISSEAVYYAKNVLRATKGIITGVEDMDQFYSKVLACKIVSKLAFNASLEYLADIKSKCQDPLEKEAVSFIVRVLEISDCRNRLKYLIEELGVYRGCKFLHELDISSAEKYIGEMKEDEWIPLDIKAQVKTASYVIQQLEKGDSFGLEEALGILIVMRMYNTLVHTRTENEVLFIL